jgi:hypothetical protein
MNLTLTTAPTEAEILALLTVAELKANMRIVHSSQDTLIEQCILEAYAYLDGRDGWLNRAILTQQWTLKLPGFVKPRLTSDLDGRPGTEWIDTDQIDLPLPRLQSVQSITYVDEDGATQTFSSTKYHVAVGEYRGYIVLKSGESWPTVAEDHPEAVTIAYTAGYGAAAAVKTHARGIVRGLKVLASDFFRNPEDTYAEPRLVAVNRKIINGLEKVAGRYRVPRSF